MRSDFDRPTLLDIPADQFLVESWGKKPRLMKQTFALGDALLSPDELAGLAVEEYIESRVVIYDPNTLRWQVDYGPFNAESFATLPQDHWTLLVQDVDKFIPAVAHLLEQVSFIPRYLLDDIMISYATKGGSVGAHIDQYHVFLIQAAGRREWQIEQTPQLNDEYIPDIEIRLLKNFSPATKMIVEPGDVLYLPPRFAHHGIALDHDCMTYSIGFRAPSLGEMLGSFTQHIQQEQGADVCLADSPLLPIQPPGEIRDDYIRHAQQFLLNALSNEDQFVSWLGAFLSEPKFRLDSESNQKSSERASRLVRDENCRAYYLQRQDGTFRLFVDGTIVVVPNQDTKLAKDLCNHASVPLPKHDLPPWLMQLVAAGCWYRE